MRLSKLEFGLIGLTLAAVITAVVYLLPSGKPVNGAAVDDSWSPTVTAQRARPGAANVSTGTAEKVTGKVAKKKSGWFSHKDKEAKEGLAAAVVKEPAVPTPAQLAAIKAVGDWETLVDKMTELKDAPTKEQVQAVKEAFDKLDKKDQPDAVKRAVNLLPDEQFPALYGILFDKAENEEILDTIFSDALNRPEEIKVPLMKELVLDKAHPMFFESARILDVTGELDKMTGKTPPVTDEEAAMEEEVDVPFNQAVPATGVKAAQ